MAPPPPTSTLRVLKQEDVHRICSGQSVIDLATCVKELVENALDAGATQIDVKLNEYGRDGIEVSDNGCGIAAANYATLALKHYTSKIHAFEDIASVASFGFRGEALSSICQLVSSFTVCTRTRDDELAMLLTYDRSGALAQSIQKARPVGTSIVIEELFKPLPVRLKDFHRNIKKHYSKLLKVLQAYAVSCVNVKISVSNTTGKNSSNRQVVLATQAHQSMGDNIASVFGTKFFRTLTSVSIDLNETWPQAAAAAPPEAPVLKTPSQEETKDDQGGHDGDDDDEDMPQQQLNESQEDDPSQLSQQSASFVRRVTGFVSRVGEGVGRSDNDRQFFFINNRPFDLPKLSKAVNDVWRQFEMKQKPACVLNFVLPHGEFDVNVTPDKRETFLRHEAHLIESFKTQLTKIYEPSRGTFFVQPLLTAFAKPRATPSGAKEQADVPLAMAAAGDGEENEQRLVVEETTSTTVTASSQHSSNSSSTIVGGLTITFEPMLQDIVQEDAVVAVAAAHGSGCCSHGHDDDHNGDDDDVLMLEQETTTNQDRHQYLQQSHGNGEEEEEERKEEIDEETKQADRDTPSPSRPRYLAYSPAPPPPQEQQQQQRPPAEDSHHGSKRTKLSASAPSSELIITTPSAMPPLQHQQLDELVGEWSLAEMKRQRATFFQQEVEREHHHQRNSKRQRLRVSKASHADALQPDQDLAAAALQRVLQKSDFAKMQVVGQFNLGFVIGKLANDDLFIIDQHASDEKYNYEMLQQTTVLHQQPLVRPLPMEITAQEEMVILDHLEVFTRHGFTFLVRKDAPPTKKLLLLSLPFSKQTQFGVDDIRELASLLMETPSLVGAQSKVRLPKLMAMFASRACRSSIMIGTALHKEEMTKIVHNLATLEQPWNCPHGRPTLRHLLDLSQLDDATTATIGCATTTDTGADGTAVGGAEL